jgi:hypothetical protein
MVVAAACLLDVTPAGAAALEHVSRPMEGDAGFVQQVGVRPCNRPNGCGPTTRPADNKGLFEKVADEEKSSVRPCNKSYGCNIQSIRPDDVGSFVKNQPSGQWAGFERDLLARSKQMPPTTITTEDASAHIGKLKPILEQKGYTVERFPGSGVPFVRITAPPAR